VVLLSGLVKRRSPDFSSWWKACAISAKWKQLLSIISVSQSVRRPQHHCDAAAGMSQTSQRRKPLLSMIAARCQAVRDD
jgi:hypothetical protein